MSETGNCPVCTHSIEDANWTDHDFWGDGIVTVSGICSLCMARIYKEFKYTGVKLDE